MPPEGERLPIHGNQSDPSAVVSAARSVALAADVDATRRNGTADLGTGATEPNPRSRDSHAPRDYYRELKSRVDIRGIAHELLSERITAETLDELQVDCPRHQSQSKTSLRITPNKQLWYCHGCRLGGDVIQLVEFVQSGSVSKCTKGNISETHRAARDWLAERAGLPALRGSKLTEEEVAQLEAVEAEREATFGALTAIAERYHQALLAAPKVTEWICKKYGFGRDVIERFKLGWANDSAAFSELLLEGFSRETLFATGAFHPGRNDRTWPFFKARVVIPYFFQGRVVYLIGRRTPWSPDDEYERAKYKKLPVHHEEKHPAVSKVIDNSVLFGEDILASRPQAVVITEGIMDAIAAMAAGFCSVSPVTVRFRHEDGLRIGARLRGVARAHIVLDNEISGVGHRAACEMADLLEGQGIHAGVVDLPLRREQDEARRELGLLLGEGVLERALRAQTSERKRLIEQAIADRPQDRERVDQLIEASKIDVCEWFRLGGTAQEFEQVLATGRESIEVEIDDLEHVDDPRARGEAIASVLRRIALRAPVLQEEYLKRVKKVTGVGLKALRAQLFGTQREARDDAAKKAREGAVPGPSEIPYLETPRGIVRLVRSEMGLDQVPLTNFTARITASISQDDGLTKTTVLEIDVEVGDSIRRALVPASAFDSLGWVMSQIGPEAIVYAGASTRDHARVAIQILSDEIGLRTVYTHTGWRDIEGVGACYLHAGGAIGPIGPVPGLEVALPTALARYILPAAPGGDALVRAIRACLDLLRLGPDRILFVLLAAVWRAILGDCDLSLHLVGPTGSFKTAVAAIFQSFWGAQFDALNLPGSWLSTGNSIEALCFSGKDVMVVIDDFAPIGSQHDVQRYHREADRVFRGQANRSGRGRLRQDGTLIAARPSRAFIVSTGEEIPAGQSLRARLLVIEFTYGEIGAGQLSLCQKVAAEGTYAAVTAAFVQWASSRLDELRRRLRERVSELRVSAHATGQHRRTPSNVAELLAGFEFFLEFARAAVAITDPEQTELRNRCWAALTEVADVQAGHVQAGEPTGTFLRLLRAAVATGKAHVANRQGREPEEEVASALGWRLVTLGIGACPREEWRPQGDLVGWVDKQDLYLEPTASYKVAQAMAGETDRLTIDARTLAKRLSEKKRLVTENEARGKHTVRKTLQGSVRYVLHLRASELVVPESRAQRANQTIDPGSDGGEVLGNEDPVRPLAHSEPVSGQGRWPTVDGGRSPGGVPGPIGPSRPENCGADPDPAEAHTRIVGPGLQGDRAKVSADHAPAWGGEQEGVAAVPESSDPPITGSMFDEGTPWEH